MTGRAGALETDILLRGSDRLPTVGTREWVHFRRSEIDAAFDKKKNGHLPEWRQALKHISPSDTPPVLDAPVVWDGSHDKLDEAAWKSFHPWRKGPFKMGGLDIDTEWRSDMKWTRLLPVLQDMSGRLVLDVGCGNGYHCWRMRGAGAAHVIGLDPFLLYVMQFLAVQKRIQDPAVRVLPLAAEHLQPGLDFDTVFSMGVLYHCRDPQMHLGILKQVLRPEGQLVLETLTVPDEWGPLFFPQGRYAKMRKIHALPTVDTAIAWLKTAGFRQVAHVDTTQTTSSEQRSTEWMTFQSLSDFLNPDDPSRTVEGHPAPERSLFTALR